LIIEIAVTHKVARAKLREVRRRNLPAIEIRLDPSDSLLRRELLRNKLRDASSKVWLFHPDQREAEREFVSKFRALLVQRRTELHESTDRRRVPIPPFWEFRPSFWTTPSSSALPASSSGYVYDRKIEEFKRRHGHYPTLDEWRRLWPRVHKPRVFKPAQVKEPPPNHVPPDAGERSDIAP